MILVDKLAANLLSTQFGTYFHLVDKSVTSGFDIGYNYDFATTCGELSTGLSTGPPSVGTLLIKETYITS